MTKKIKTKSVLVIFGKCAPSKIREWQKQFDKVMKENEVEQLIGPGNVEEAYRFFRRLPKPTVDYRGYNLWWMHHDDIYHKFCLPFTQYRDLLMRLKEFDRVELFQPPLPDLFRYFLEAHHCECVIRRQKRFFPPFGILIQLSLSFIFLFWSKITGPRVLLETSDRFSPPDNFDFRYKFIYQELKNRKLPYIEFIRSLEPWTVVLKHAWVRRRPVIYSAAIVDFMHSLAGIFGERKLSSKGDDLENFWFLAATHYLRNVRGTIWSVKILELICRWIGLRAAMVPTACSRNFHEVLACKLGKIGVVGIMHGGAVNQYYDVYDFMPGFAGENKLSVDKYGLWSDWWREYYIKNSDAFKPEQLYVSGPMRPLAVAPFKAAQHCAPHEGTQRVLFISEGLAAPSEVMPYLSALLAADKLTLYVKFRPYRDAFELWLKEHEPKVYEVMLKKAKIFRGIMDQALLESDIAVGSHSTGALEALLHLKPFVFFWTQKWDDYFKLGSIAGDFFAQNPHELIERIEKSREIKKIKLLKLQKQFFGDPHQNGSKWVVDQIEKYL